MTAPVMVDAVNVHKRFGSVEVLRGLTLSVREGEVCCIIGPSGSGKSTFLRCINHLEKIQAGTLTVGSDTLNTADSTKRPAITDTTSNVVNLAAGTLKLLSALATPVFPGG